MRVTVDLSAMGEQEVFGIAQQAIKHYNKTNMQGNQYKLVKQK